MKSNNIAKLSKGALEALKMIKEYEGVNELGVTASILKEKGLEGLNSAHLNALVNRELVVAKQVNIVCPCCGSKRKANAYKMTEKGHEFKGE